MEIFQRHNKLSNIKRFNCLVFPTTCMSKNTESEEWIYWSFIFMQKLEWKPWIRHDLGLECFTIWDCQVGIGFGRMLLDIIPSTLWWWVVRSITRVIRRFHTLIFDFFLSFWFRTAFLGSEHCSFSNWSKYLTEATSIFGYTFVR